MAAKKILWTMTGAVALCAGMAQADVLVTPTLIYTGTVIRAENIGIVVKSDENELTVRREDIKSAEVAKPDSYDKSVAAARAGKFPEALAGFKALSDHYAGLPIPWAEDSLSSYGEMQVAVKDYAGAKKTFDRFKAWYPRSQRVQVMDAKYARILFEQKEPEKAMQLIQGVLDPLMKKESLSEEQENGVAEGLVLLGDCQMSLGKMDDALDNYLRVIALYDVDNDRTAEAKFKSAKILEQHGNWKHAKQNYEDILKETPEVAFADDAKKRLSDLNTSHPE